MRISFSKRFLSVLLAVLMVATMVPMMAISASAEELTGTISTYEELVAAATDGGTYDLTADITVPDETVFILKDLTINGGGHTIKATVARTIFSFNNTTDAKITATNLTLDGSGLSLQAINAWNKNLSNEGNVVTLTDCTVKNFAGRQWAGAIYLYSHASGVFTNCTFTGNTVPDTTNYYTGADIWAGAAANVTLVGGTYGEVFVNNGGELHLKNGVVIDKLPLEKEGSSETIVKVYHTNVVVKDLTFAGSKAITTPLQLYTACILGGSYKLGNDITTGYQGNVYHDLTIAGNNHTIATTTKGVDTFWLKAANLKLTLSDMKLDGTKVAREAVDCYLKSNETDDTVVTLTNLEICNYKSTDYCGAVYLFDKSTGIVNNCKFHDNEIVTGSTCDGQDIWVGAAGKLTIVDSTMDQACLHGGTAEATISGSETKIGEMVVAPDTSGKSDVKIELKDEAAIDTLTAPNYVNATITDDGTTSITTVDTKEEEGTESKTLTKGNKIYGTRSAMTKANDDKIMGATFKQSFELVGTQYKNDQSGIRFVAVIKNDIVKDADDYGFIIGTTTLGKETARGLLGNITLDNAPTKSVWSCKETDNTVSGNYGLYDTDTAYKYITAGVENIPAENSDTMFVARAYVTVNGKTVYGDYIVGSDIFDGCATSLDDATAVVD